MTAETARTEIFSRVKNALAGAADVPLLATADRRYAEAHVQTGLDDLLAVNLSDYRARVHRCVAADLPDTIARLLTTYGSSAVLVPRGLPHAWLDATDIARLDEDDPLSLAELDRSGALSVLTGCALAIAEIGTLVLDGGPGQGKRRSTLIPDHHICVVRCPDQVVASLPQALPLLDHRRPLTWIAGPSATSDIELDRVEGVHGPRRLDAVLVSP